MFLLRFTGGDPSTGRMIGLRALPTRRLTRPGATQTFSRAAWGSRNGALLKIDIRQPTNHCAVSRPVSGDEDVPAIDD
jgi:hypothetical protein